MQTQIGRTIAAFDPSCSPKISYAVTNLHWISNQVFFPHDWMNEKLSVKFIPITLFRLFMYLGSLL